VCKNFVGSFLCICPAGWTGQTCGENIDDCINQPCQHDGYCSDAINGFICNCTGTGFQGPVCEININDCIENPCLNNGICVDGVNTFTCDCSSTGFHGNKCENEINVCDGSPCQNNGTCHNSDSSYICNCTDTGYTGKNCDADLDECMEQMHKCGLGSSCLNLIGTYTCICSDGSTGQLCDMNLEASQKEAIMAAENRTVVIVSVIVIVIVIKSLVMYLLWYLKKSRRMKGRYMPSEVEQNATPAIPLEKMIDPINGERLI
ncbi:hypothetical protein ACJMK2_040279, partial [Sinanodonta woodiana]